MWDGWYLLFAILCITTLVTIPTYLQSRRRLGHIASGKRVIVDTHNSEFLGLATCFGPEPGSNCYRVQLDHFLYTETVETGDVRDVFREDDPIVVHSQEINDPDLSKQYEWLHGTYHGNSERPGMVGVNVGNVRYIVNRANVSFPPAPSDIEIGDAVDVWVNNESLNDWYPGIYKGGEGKQVLVALSDHRTFATDIINIQRILPDPGVGYHSRSSLSQQMRISKQKSLGEWSTERLAQWIEPWSKTAAAKVREYNITGGQLYNYDLLGDDDKEHVKILLGVKDEVIEALFRTVSGNARRLGTCEASTLSTPILVGSVALLGALIAVFTFWFTRKRHPAPTPESEPDLDLEAHV